MVAIISFEFNFIKLLLTLLCILYPLFLLGILSSDNAWTIRADLDTLERLRHYWVYIRQELSSCHRQHEPMSLEENIFIRKILPCTSTCHSSSIYHCIIVDSEYDSGVYTRGPSLSRVTCRQLNADSLMIYNYGCRAIIALMSVMLIKDFTKQGRF